MNAIDLTRASSLLRFWTVRRWYHRAEITFQGSLPPGGVLLVSNHGRLDFDVFILMNLVLRYSGRLIRPLTDRLWFRLPVFRRFLPLTGAVEGTRSNAISLLKAGQLVLTYPGGVREIMSSRYGHEHISWEGRVGFAHVALSAGVPIVPVAGIGVNNGFFFLTSGRWLGRLLYRGIFRLGPAWNEYRDPLALGILPVPLPFSTAVHFPFPCKISYFVGEPIHPLESEQADDPQAVSAFASRVEAALRQLIADKRRSMKEWHS